MKFNIEQETLKKALVSVQGVTDKKATIPVLQNLLIESAGDSLIKIVATNLDTAVTKDVEVDDISRPGSICIPARKLIEITNNSPAGMMSFEAEDNDWVKLAVGRSKFRLAGVPRDRFPEVPEPKNLPININGDLFAEMIGKVTFAITNESSRFTLSGAKFIVADGRAVLVSTDGHRLSYVERSPAEGQPSLDDLKLDVLIPKPALIEVSKMSHTGSLMIGEDIHHVFFRGGGQLLSTRKLTGSFPNYEMVLPKDNDQCVIVDGEAFRAAVKRVALMADARNQSMKITVKPNEVLLLAESHEQGEGREFVEAEFGGDELMMGFNWHYLGEFLNIVRPEDKVVMTFKDAHAQTEWRIAGDDGFRHVIMPLRVL